MWSVIRKKQGITQNVSVFSSISPGESFERNQRIILHHEAKPFVPELDPDVFTRAYDDFNFEKIRRWMLAENPDSRFQAVDQLTELYVEQRENCARSLPYHLLEILLSLMCTDEVPDIRERAATAMSLLVREPVAQTVLLELDQGGQRPFERILACLADPIDGVVVVVLRVIAACHARYNSYALTELFTKKNSIPLMVNLLRSESIMVKAVTCLALLPIFDVKEAHILFLREGGMRVVTEALEIDDAMLIANGAEVISRAAEFPQGKRDAVESQTLRVLCRYIQYDNLTPRVAVLSAMAQITVLESARMQAVEFGVAERVKELLSVEDERDVLVHLSRLIFHIAEWPEGRRRLLPCRERLEELIDLAEDDPTILHVFESTIEILNKRL